MKKLVAMGLIAVVMLTVLTGCEGNISIVVNEKEEATAQGSEHIDLEDGASILLDVRNNVGSVVIDADEDAEDIQVDYTFTAYGDTVAEAEAEAAEMTVTVEQDGDRVQIDAVQAQFRDHSRTNKVDLRITVPPTLDLVVRNDVGDVEITGVATPAQLDLSNDVGPIVVREVDAGPQTTITVDVGDITFEGTLAESGSASMTTNVGSVHVRVPEDTAAALDATTNVGKVDVRGLTLSGKQSDKTNITGAHVTGALGGGGVSLTLKANVGDVELRQL